MIITERNETSTDGASTKGKFDVSHTHAVIGQLPCYMQTRLCRHSIVLSYLIKEFENGRPLFK